MVAVRGPVAAVLGADGHDRVEVAAELVDRGAESGDVGVGEVALVGRGLDPVDRQPGEDLPAPAERVPVRCQDGAAVGLDRLRESGDSGRWSPAPQRERGATSGFFRERRGFFAVFASAIPHLASRGVRTPRQVRKPDSGTGGTRSEFRAMTSDPPPGGSPGCAGRPDAYYRIVTTTG